MQVITHQDKVKWNCIVKSFSNWDVYYLNEYAISFMKHGDGTPLLFYYEDNNCRLCYVSMLEDISRMDVLKGELEPSRYFDLTTPYGYGGPVVDGEFDAASQKAFAGELDDYCKKNHIVSQFIRFHPILANHVFWKDITETCNLKETIVIDTSSYEMINQNMDSKNRNMIRKAKKMGVTIEHDSGERIEEFKMIYESTMQENQATRYYYFEREYYDCLLSDMRDNTIFFYAYAEGKMIGSAIFFYNEKYMHYHLSGTLKQFRSMASTNLLLMEAALWACDHGIGLLHLGGGLEDADSLFGFKKQFNRNGKLPFYIGRKIFDTQAYDEILCLRKSMDPVFDKNNSRLIQYGKV